MKKFAILIGVLALLAVFGVGAVGLDKTKQARDVDLEDLKRSGFLDDYSILKKSDSDDATLALYAFVNPEADWTSYKNIQLEPVQIWRSKSDEGSPPEDVQRLANDFFVLIRDELAKDYNIVGAAGPDTFRFQVVLVNLQKGIASLDKVTTIVPMARALSGAKKFITGKPSFVGEASIEVKATDTESGELLLAAVDRRVGDKSLVKEVGTWEDVHNNLRVWSQITRFRFCQLRGGTDCQKPDM